MGGVIFNKKLRKNYLEIVCEDVTFALLIEKPNRIL